MPTAAASFFIFIISLFATQNEFKFDGHLHCSCPPEAPTTVPYMIEFHKDRHMTAMAITNHEPGSIYADIEAANHSFVSPNEFYLDPEFPVLPGLEWSSRSLHVLIYWDPRNYNDVRNLILYNDTYKNIFWDSGICRENQVYSNLSSIVHDLGGILGVAHYEGTVASNIADRDAGCVVPTLEFLYQEANFDFISVFNGLMMTYDFTAKSYANNYGIPKITGSDWHTGEETYVMVPTTIYADNATNVDIWQAIKDGKTDVIFDMDDVTTSLGGGIIAAIISGVISVFFFIVISIRKCFKK